MHDPYFDAAPNPPLHDSLTAMPEGELLARMVASPRFYSSYLTGIVGMPENPRPFLSVQLAGTPAAVETDVDLLLIDPHAPWSAVAIEAKRIKVQASTFKSGEPNKLREYAKAVEQANQLARVGFSQVYLYVFVIVDSRANNAGLVSYEGLTPALRARIDQVVTLEGLDPRIGLVKLELIQAMDYEPLSFVAGGTSIRRAATIAEQPAELTRWLTELGLPRP